MRKSISFCLSIALKPLSRIIGEDKTLVVKFGADAGDNATEETVLVRGVSADVDRAVKEIRRIVEDAKNDEIVNSYVSFLAR